MSERSVSLRERTVEVRRWLRANVEVETGAMVPFMVAMSDAQFVRDNQATPFVLNADGIVWFLEIISIESTGTEGVWVSARAISRLGEDSAEGDIRGTLTGIPVPGLDDD